MRNGRQKPNELVSALVYLLPGHTNSEVEQKLREHAATEVEILAKGFLSTVAPRQALSRAESIARVEVKKTKKLHGQ